MLKQLTVSDGANIKPRYSLRISGVGGFLFALIFICGDCRCGYLGREWCV